MENRRQLHRKTLNNFWSETYGYRKHFLFMLIGIAIGISAQLLVPYIFKLMVDMLEAGTGSYEIAFKYLVYATIAGLVLEQGWRLAGYLASYVVPKMNKEITNKCYNHVFKQSHEFFANTFTGSLVKKINRYSGSFDTIINHILWGFIPQAVRISMTTIGMLVLDWRLSLIFVAWLIVFTWGNLKYIKLQTKYDAAYAATGTRVTAHSADTITNQENLRYFASHEKESLKMYQVLTDQEEAERKSWRISEMAILFRAFAIVMGEFFIFWYALRLWNAGSLTFGTVVALQSYVTLVMFRLWDLSRDFRRLFKALADAEEMEELFEVEGDIVDASGSKDINLRDGAIQFKNVGFEYIEDQPVLDNFDLNIRSGEKIGLVGLSGSGKSTLIKLLLRLYEIDTGEILVGGNNIQDFKQNSLRSQISFVPQDPMMFHRSIRENLIYGRPEATEEEILDAAKKAYCDEFIGKAPDRYETLVGERGIKLSGGERQRLAIARAILKDAPIFILDEATSSLDSKSEKYIQDALHNVMEGKTVIAIAHRLSTIREMDRIVVMENGKILEMGTHDELMKNDEKYAELWRIQSGEIEN